MDLILSATVKTGGAYVYANFRGCDGSRCYLDGSSMIAMNGQFYALGKQNSLEEIEVISSAIDLSEVDSYRSPVCSRSL